MKKLGTFIILILGTFGLFAQLDTSIHLSGINCRNETETLITTHFQTKDCFTICATDKDWNNVLYLKADNLPDGASFSYLEGENGSGAAQLCFTPKIEPDVVDTYRFNIKAYQNANFEGNYNEKEYAIVVYQVIDFKFIYELKNCGEISVQVEPLNDVAVSQWMFNCNGKVIITNGLEPNAVFKNIQNGDTYINVSAIGQTGMGNIKSTSFEYNNGVPFWTNKYEVLQCNNDEVRIDLEDFASKTTEYQWLNFQSPNEKVRFLNSQIDTTYSVIGVDGSCIDTLVFDHKVLNTAQNFTKSEKSGNNPLLVEIDLDGKSDADTFVVNFGDNSFGFYRKNDFPISKIYNEIGSYSISIQSSKYGIRKCSQNFNFNPINIYPTSIELANNSTLKFYPNPSTQNVTIDSNFPILKTYIFDLNGQLLLSSNQKTIDVSMLKSGTYFIKIIALDDTEYVSKMIKE